MLHTYTSRRLIAGYGDSYLRQGNFVVDSEVQTLMTTQNLAGATIGQADIGIVGYVDYSKSGDTTAQRLTVIDDVIKKNPSVVLLNCGINDMTTGVSIDDAVSNLQKMFNMFELYGIRVVYFPVVKLGGQTNAMNAKIESFRARMEQVVVHHSNVYPVEYSNFKDDRSMLQSDNVHPTAFGSTMMGRDAAVVLEKLIASTFSPTNLLTNIPFASWANIVGNNATGQQPTGWNPWYGNHGQDPNRSGWHKISSKSTDSANNGTGTLSQVYTNSSGSTQYYVMVAEVASDTLDKLDYGGIYTQHYRVSDGSYVGLANAFIKGYAQARSDNAIDAHLMITAPLAIPNGDRLVAACTIKAPTGGPYTGSVSFNNPEVFPVSLTVARALKAGISDVIEGRPTYDRAEGEIIAKDTGWFEKSRDKDPDQILYEYDQNGGFLAYLESKGYKIDDEGRVTPIRPVQ